MICTIEFRRCIVGLSLLFCPWIATQNTLAADAVTRPADATSNVLFLLNRKNPDTIVSPMPILGRELYRQGLLIAARDELGLQTRDGSLREWSDAPPPATSWTVVPGRKNMKIVAGALGAVWEEDLSTTDEWQKNVVGETIKIESLSREEFVKQLTSHGFSGKPHARKPDGVVPAETEARVGNFDELSQFIVLRETHHLISVDGESEARLGVLVRAYANLGQLTRYHWSTDHEVFAARSLLYAQRMVAVNRKSPIALWHRAYAMAMAGWQGQAMKDIAAAEALGHGVDAPAWGEALLPFCKYDLGKLSDVAASKPAVAPLAMYLGFGGGKQWLPACDTQHREGRAGAESAVPSARRCDV